MMDARSKEVEILRARAKALARPRATAEAPREAIELLLFTVAGETYGVEVAYVAEVAALKMLAALPGMPACVRGVVNLRGRVVAALDVRKLFDLAERGISDLGKLVVLGHSGSLVAVLCDAILGTRRLPVSELQAPLPAHAAAGDLVRGTTSERLVVLAAERLLSSPRLSMEQQSAT